MSILCIVEKDTISKKFDFSEGYTTKVELKGWVFFFLEWMVGWVCVY